MTVPVIAADPQHRGWDITLRLTQEVVRPTLEWKADKKLDRASDDDLYKEYGLGLDINGVHCKRLPDGKLRCCILIAVTFKLGRNMSMQPLSLDW